MQFEEFDNKTRDAADNHHPPYDENAWARMEKLLDKHMPVEKDNRKRVIFFLLFFLFLGGAGFWLFSGMPGIGNKKQAINNQDISIQQKAGNASSPVSTNFDNKSKDSDNIFHEKKSGKNIPVDGKISTIHDGSGFVIFDLSQGKKNIRNKNIITDQPGQAPDNKSEPAIRNDFNDKPNNNQVFTPTENTTLAFDVPDQKNNKSDVLSEKNQNSKVTDTKPRVNIPSDKEKESIVQKSEEKKKDPKRKRGNNFFFTLAMGPDFSFSANDKLGKTKLLSGAGLGYTIKNRITIRSGFYSGRKIYTASPGSYHPPAIFWNYYPNLEKVDADCRVYEIPLTLSYHFGNSLKQNWFASAGLSSYLMKKETYNYYYKTNPTGPTVQRKWTIQDENKHYFSVLTLSGGYQKNIGKSFTVMAEPYIKIPLSGVGYGNVKLNSGGLLITVGYKPFAGSGNHYQKINK